MKYEYRQSNVPRFVCGVSVTESVCETGERDPGIKIRERERDLGIEEGGESGERER